MTMAPLDPALPPTLFRAPLVTWNVRDGLGGRGAVDLAKALCTFRRFFDGGSAHSAKPIGAASRGGTRASPGPHDQGVPRALAG